MNNKGKKVKKILSVVFVIFMALVMIVGSFSFAAGESEYSATPTQKPETIWKIAKGESFRMEDVAGYYIEWQPGYWGRPTPKTQAEKSLREKLVKVCKPEWIQSTGSSIVVTNQYAQAETDECWGIIESLLGRKPASVIPKKMYVQLKNQSKIVGSTGSTYLYVTESGIPIGWSKVVLDPQSSCGLNSLAFTWWDGSPFVVVDMFQKEIWDVFYQNGMSGLLKKDNLPKIPDFCQGQNFKTTNPPTWVRIAPQNDMFRLDYPGMAIQVHTNYELCDQFVWYDEASYLVVIPDAKRNLHAYQLMKGDIVVIKSASKSAYFTVIGTQLRWMTPKSGVNFVPSIELTTACEGGLCAIIRTDPDPYVLDGGLPIPQHGATDF